MTLFTIGYGLWPPAERMEALLRTLTEAGVRLLIDIRHSPCSSQLDPKSHYGPRLWHLQAGGGGIEESLLRQGIEYRWLVEVGNPQINDKGFRVLKEHLASDDERWPVNCGLKVLEVLLRAAGPCALLCACADWRKCHRTLIAEAAQRKFPSVTLDISHLPH
jgi:hypothetical protein